MRAILICYFFFLSFSCGSNISKEKVQEQEITIKKWINGCESTKLVLKQINYMNEMIEGSELDITIKRSDRYVFFKIFIFLNLIKNQLN